MFKQILWSIRFRGSPITTIKLFKCDRNRLEQLKLQILQISNPIIKIYSSVNSIETTKTSENVIYCLKAFVSILNLNNANIAQFLDYLHINFFKLENITSYRKTI